MTGNFTSQSFTYNSMLQLTGVNSVPSAGPAVNIQYNYSPNQNNGKIVSETNVVSGETVSYTYDALNRLATAVSNSSSAPWGQAFTYDGFGNLTNVNVIAGSAPIYSANPDPATNRLSCTDANGNSNVVGLCGIYGNLYDVENRLVSASVPYQQSGGYAYAPGNKRVARAVSAYNSGTGQWTQTTDEVTFWAPNGQKLATYQLTTVLGCQFATDPCGSVGPGVTPPLFFANQTGTYYYFGGRMVKNAHGWVYPDRLGSIGKFYPYGWSGRVRRRMGRRSLRGI